MKRKILLLLSVVGLGCLIIFILLARSLYSQLNGEWSLKEVENYLQAPLPKNAEILLFEAKNGNHGYYEEFQSSFYIKLKFEAPPQQALEFASSVCSEELYIGYDPFNASENFDFSSLPSDIVLYR